MARFNYEQERNMSDIFKTTKDFTQDERLRLMEQFKGSGLAYDEFAREHNVNSSTLKNWITLSRFPSFERKRKMGSLAKKCHGRFRPHHDEASTP